MKIAIDGPTASGKGTLTKLLATHLNCKYLNTGKLYRVIAFSINPEFDAIAQAISHSEKIEKYLELFAEDDGIYSQNNGLLASKIASIKQVRENLLDFQRSFAEINNPVILEGRDIGTHILPDADYKFFITASPEERAKRRHEQDLQNGKNSNYEDVLQSLTKRDEQDSTRKINPLKPAEDTIIIDTTGKTIQESFEMIVQNIK